MLAALTALIACMAAPAAHAAIAYAPCQPAGYQCGTLSVPLDRSGAVPGTVTLSATRVVATSNPTKTAVVGLAGGPGQAAIPNAQSFARIASAGLATRDLLVFDQRGTGASGRLRCAAFERPSISTVATVNACAQELGAAPRPVPHGRVRRRPRGAAGRVAATTSSCSSACPTAPRSPSTTPRSTPTHVESLILDSMVPPEGSDPLQPDLAAGRRAGPRRRSAAAAHAGASPPRPLSDMSRLVRRMVKAPLRGTSTRRSARPSGRS